MIDVDEFREMLGKGEFDRALNEVILADGAAHVSNEDIEYIKLRIAETYSVDKNCIEIWITGSAKLGFSLVPKTVNGEHFERYRPFSALSDIDVSIVSPLVFQKIWKDLSKRAHRVSVMPWNSQKLGDYMIYGWLRPDHFPTDVRVRNCDDWWDLFRRFSVDPRFERRKVRGGLFYSRTQLNMYLRRSLRDCAKAEELGT